MFVKNLNSNPPRIRAEISLSAIAHNISELKKITAPKSKFMAVVKANAYGHGLIEVALCAVENGANYLGVAEINEGILIRKAGIGLPVLILGYTPPHFARELLDHDLTQTIFSLEMAQELSKEAFLSKKKIKVHIKVDTGMGRLGILHDSFKKEFERIYKLKGFIIEGIFTHFASSDSSDKTYTLKQFKLFNDIIDYLGNTSMLPEIRHAANSGALIDIPETHLDMVRAGISIYGLYPSKELVNKSRICLKPAMSLKANIIHLKKVKAETYISYNSTYKTDSATIIATIPVGYADGINRRLSSYGYMLVNGYKAPIVGRICMDLTMLDVGNIPDVKIGDEAVIFGCQKKFSISIDEVAESLNTINYEVITSVASRVPRIYYSKNFTIDS